MSTLTTTKNNTNFALQHNTNQQKPTLKPKNNPNSPNRHKQTKNKPQTQK